jgi:DNA-binding NarL/FixJ family response regulator
MIKKIKVKKVSLFIIDSDDYGVSMKYSLEKKFLGNIIINAFQNIESCFEVLKFNKEKIDIVILGSFENKELPEKNSDQLVNYIQEISPETSVIILSDNKGTNHIIKASEYGICHFIPKNDFGCKNIFSSVERRLSSALA